MTGVLLFLVGVVGSILAGQYLGSFIHIPSIVFVVVVGGGLALMRYRRGDGRVKFLESLKRYVLISGVLGCIIGVIQMASHYSKAEAFNSANIFAGFGIAVLAIFYGLIFYCIIDAFTGRVSPGGI